MSRFNPNRRTGRIRITTCVLTIVSSVVVATNASAREPLGDPMRPPGLVADTAPDVDPAISRALVVQSILFAEDRRVAIVNDQRLQEGDQIGAARVLEITPDRVRIKRAGEVVELPVVSRAVKREVGSDRPVEIWTSPPAAPAEGAAPVGRVAAPGRERGKAE